MIVDTIMTIFGVLYLLCTTTFTFFGLLVVIGLLIYSNRSKQREFDRIDASSSKEKTHRQDQKCPVGPSSCAKGATLRGLCPAAQSPATSEAELSVEQIKFILKSDKASAPERGTAYSAGYDLKSVETCIIPAKSHKPIKTDIVVVLPKNTCGRIASRSGLSFKNGIEVGAGVIDEDYRNELMINLYNHSDEEFCVEENQRIAQLIVHRIAYPDTLVEDVNGNIRTNNTCIRPIRGLGGFGSTG
jgi:dUTP pyrophosphatase